jgi:hypothetical protein
MEKKTMFNAAMTIVPNLLLTGILNILVSLALVGWALFGRGKQYGRILLLLSVAMMLFGGGFGPPIIGILASVAGMGAGSPLTRWRKRLSPNVRRFLAAAHPWAFGITAANGVFLVIGSVILVYGFDLNKPDLFTNSFFFSVVSLLLTIVTGRAYDIERQKQISQPEPGAARELSFS